MNVPNFKTNTKSYAVNLLLLFCILYGCYQLFMDGGIFTLYKINQELKQQKLENELLKKRQTYLEERVNKLEEDKNFDYDYFEEILRKKLGVIKPSEKVIFVENNQEEKNGK